MNLQPNLWGHLQAPIIACVLISLLVLVIGYVMYSLWLEEERIEKRYHPKNEDGTSNYNKWEYPKIKLPVPVRMITWIIVLIIAAVSFGGAWMSYEAASYDCSHNYKKSECWTVTDKYDIKLHGDVKTGR